MFWLDNLNILTMPILIPDINMTFEEKLNSIIRGLLFLGIIFTLIFNDSKYFAFASAHFSSLKSASPSLTKSSNNFFVCSKLVTP
jgi:hypothetical protein